MINRVDFLESVKGIQYPDMLVNFFDHFIALKALVEDHGKVTVLESGPTFVSFSVRFKNKGNRDSALTTITNTGGCMYIYQRPISVVVKPLTDSELSIYLS